MGTVGPVVVEVVGGEDDAERFVEQDVALSEEATERDLSLVGRARLRPYGRPARVR